MFKVEMEFIPGNPQIWVLKLNPDDPIYEYESELEAQIKAQELQELDSTGRKYRVSNVLNS